MGAFVAELNPTVDELADIKTAVSEAVTNCIIHGYEQKEGSIWIHCLIEGNTVEISVIDSGKGIRDIEQASTMLQTSPILSLTMTSLAPRSPAWDFSKSCWTFLSLTLVSSNCLTLPLWFYA
mgnify:CR=1 FL=1